MDRAPSDLLGDLLQRARKAGADAADAMLVESGALAVTRRLGKLEKVERAESHDLGLRVFVGRRQAVVSTGELDGAALDRLALQAVTIAKAVPEDKYAGLAEPSQIATTVAELDLDDGVEPDADALAELAGAAEEAALAHPKITNSEGAEADWSRSRTTLAATNGFVGSIARSSHGLSAAVIAGEGGAMERDYEFATVIRAVDLPDPATLGREAAERAVRRLNPRKVRSQAVPVVFEPRVAGSIIRHLVSAISGPAVARGTTFLKDSMGDRIFAEGISIVEDPLREGGLRSRAFDVEGIAAQPRRLIDRGVLTTWLLDCASARQLGLQPTGHAVRGVSSAPSPAPANVHVEPGTISPQDLIRDIPAGFYVTEMMGMGINYVTGDYSRGAAGFWIENGEIASPVSEVTIAGTLQSMFQALTAASDLSFRYGIDAPTLRIEGMTVAGQ
jgi:PmbA protein